MLLYDNFEDCKAKLGQTIIYYKGKAAYVKDIQPIPNEAGDVYIDYNLTLAFVDKRNMQKVKLSEADSLNYLKYQLGYCNFHGTAIYWYRKPVKQYKQGLKADQMHYKITNPNLMLHDQPWNFTRPIIDMLEGRYPTVKEAAELLKNGAAVILAFHKDFAIAHNPVFDEFELEYKGTKIGRTPDFVNVNLTDKYAYVKEALMEAVA